MGTHARPLNNVPNQPEDTKQSSGDSSFHTEEEFLDFAMGRLDAMPGAKYEKASKIVEEIANAARASRKTAV
jgi:hypothetical protein